MDGVSESKVKEVLVVELNGDGKGSVLAHCNRSVPVMST